MFVSLNNHLPDFSFYIIYCYTTAGIAWLPQQHKKTLEQTETVAFNTRISLTIKWQWKPKVSSIPLCITYYAIMTTKVTQIITYSWVALGKHQIVQQLVGHPCSVSSEKQTSMAENLFDWCWCARCTKTLSKSGFKHANCSLWLPCVADADIIFLPCGFFFLSIFFPRLISAVAEWMSTILVHMVWP